MQVFQKFIAAPIFGQDPGKTRVAAMTNVIMLGILGITALFALVNLILFQDFLELVIFLSLLLLYLGALWLMRKGYVIPTVSLVLVFLWGIVTVLCAVSGGVTSPHFVSYITLVLMAGLLVRGRVALAFALVSSVSGLVMLNTKIQARVPQLIESTPFGIWAVISSNIMVGALLLYLASRGLRQAARQAQAHERELAEKAAQMQQLAREAQEANTFRTRLIARVSHELRTPLSAIQGFGEMLYYAMYGQLTKEQHDAVKKILQHSRHLETMVTELLEQSNFESGKLRMNITAFSPTSLLERVMETYGPVAATKGLLFHTEISPDLPESMSGDPEKLEEILSSLISNAIKFTESGSISVHMTRTNNESWAIHVSDTGIGIPQEMQAALFEPFRQADESATRMYGGVGLGLALVKELVSLMSGSVTFTSEEGIGSIFTIFLPFEAPED